MSVGASLVIMRANLTPTQVTDVNGRVTTVHKRLDTPQKAQKSRSVPAPSLTPAVPSTLQTITPIVLPEPLTEEQLEAFYEWQKPFTAKSHYRPEVVKMMNEPFDPSTQALAWRIISEKSVPEKTIVSLLNRYHGRRQSQLAKMFGSVQSELLDSLRNQLLLAERLCRKAPYEADEYFLTEKFLSKAVEGYHYKTKQEDRKQIFSFATDEELESVATVSLFILKANIKGNHDQYRQKEYVNWNGKKVEGLYIANKSLDAYLRSSPDDADRAIAYAIDRNIGNTVKDTKQLMEYLKNTESAVAIDDGWL